MKIINSSFKVSKAGHSNVTRCRSMGYTEGNVITPHGFVVVYAQGGDGRFEEYTRLDFLFNGRVHIREYRQKRYTHRGIKTLAMRFAAEVVAKASTGEAQ